MTFADFLDHTWATAIGFIAFAASLSNYVAVVPISGMPHWMALVLFIGGLWFMFPKSTQELLKKLAKVKEDIPDEVTITTDSADQDEDDR